MKKLMVVVMACSLGLVGCWSSRSGATVSVDVENMPVVVASGRSLKDAVVMAATHRRWTPSEVDAQTVRCTLVQRSHKVVVDVCLLDAQHYSIRVIESNIPARKLAQWINNLQREIALRAIRP